MSQSTSVLTSRRWWTLPIGILPLMGVSGLVVRDAALGRMTLVDIVGTALFFSVQLVGIIGVLLSHRFGWLVSSLAVGIILLFLLVSVAAGGLREGNFALIAALGYYLLYFSILLLGAWGAGRNVRT